MTKTLSRTQMIVTLGVLIGLEVVLTKLIAIQTPIMRIGFGFVPIVIIAIMFGPLWSAAAYAIGDVIGAFLFPTGEFNIGFTISAFLTGLVFGLFLYNRKITWINAVLAGLIVSFAINLLLNTLWISMIVGKGYMALLPARFVKEIASVPLYAIMIIIVDKTIMRAIKNSL